MNRRLSRPLLLAGLVLAAGTLASCTSVRNSLGTHDSQCFRVLPVARGAVGAQGTYEGVRYQPADTLLTGIREQHPAGPAVPVPASLTAAAHKAVCLVEYKGTYQLASLTDGWSPSGDTSGSYAVVVLQQSDNAVVATVLLRKPPIRFSRNYPA